MLGQDGPFAKDLQVSTVDDKNNLHMHLNDDKVRKKEGAGMIPRD